METVKTFAADNGIKVIFPDDGGYHDARKTYNTRTLATPLAIAQVKTNEEVAKLVQFSVQENIHICVRSGGNDLSGRSIVEKGLVIDVRGLNQVRVDASTQTATVGGGVSSGGLATALAEHGFVACVGTIDWVGYAGWATTGGFGPFAGKYGLGVDQIVAAKIVNAEGKVEQADASVLKAIRGASGNFGVILELTVKIYPIEKIFAGTIIFDSKEYWTSMKKVLNEIAKLNDDGEQPAELELQPVYAPSPMGKIFGLLFVWAGSDHDRAKTYLDKVASWAPVMVNQVSACTLSEFFVSNAGLAQTQTYADARTLPVKRLTPVVLDVIKKYCDSLPEDLAVGLTWHELRQCSPSAKQDHSESVFALRQPHHVVEILAQSVNNDNFDVVSRWGRDFYQELLERAPEEVLESRWVPLTPDHEMPKLEQLYGDESAAFLRRLKKERDPNGIFKYAVPRIAV